MLVCARAETMRELATQVRGGVPVRRKALLVLLRYHPLALDKFMSECCPRPTPLPTFLHLAVGLLSAYEFLGTHHVVHLDAKANNVLVDVSVPEQPVCVLADFGTARVTAADGTLPRCVKQVIPWGTQVLDPLKNIYAFCDVSMREKDWRSRARVAQAT